MSFQWALFHYPYNLLSDLSAIIPSGAFKAKALQQGFIGILLSFMVTLLMNWHNIAGAIITSSSTRDWMSVILQFQYVNHKRVCLVLGPIRVTQRKMCPAVSAFPISFIINICLCYSYSTADCEPFICSVFSP